MTTRLSGCTVVFQTDIREDDVTDIITALRMVKGVAAVEIQPAEPLDAFAARIRLGSEIRQALSAILDGKQ